MANIPKLTAQGTDMDASRFERIEKHIDKLAEKVDELTKVITELARIDERMITLFKRMDNQDVKAGALEVRLDALEKTISKRGVVYYFLDRLFWIVTGAAVVYIFKMVGGQ